MPVIRDVSAEIVEVPLRHAFVTAQDKLARHVSRPVVISLRMDDGRIVCGEAVPVAYVTGETQETVVQAVRTAAPHLAGVDVMRLRPAVETLAALLPDSPTARAGLEMAIYTAHVEYLGISLWHLFGGAVESVETDITLSIVEDVVDRALEAAEQGFRCYKMKVGGADPAGDLARILEVNRAVPSARFRLDANQGFAPPAALEFINRVVDSGVTLELVEQPVAKEDLAGLDAVAAGSPVPVFADEAVKTPADALRVVSDTRVQGINVKLMKSGFSGALDIIAIARTAGRKLMIGCMLETRRGISASLALACGTGAFDFVDLDSHLLLREEGKNPYFDREGPILRIRE